MSELGFVGVDAVEEAVEVCAGEGPFERPCDLAVVVGEREEPDGEPDAGCNPGASNPSVKLRPMARNPRWSDDELLVAIDLYVNHPRTRSDKNDPKLVEASEALRALPIHLDRPDPARFRNLNSVYLKLQNLIGSS